MHIKLSTFFYSTQLIEIFSYDNVTSYNKIPSTNLLPKGVDNLSNSTVVYNFQIIKNNWRVLFFVLNSSTLKLKNLGKSSTSIYSITELFNNANWLEREASELSNTFFYGKKDVRNLMLQYGDSSTPFKKNYPCVGLKEYLYDSNSDSIISLPTSLQF